MLDYGETSTRYVIHATVLKKKRFILRNPHQPPETCKTFTTMVDD